TDGSEVRPSLDFSPYPSPESKVVKDPSFRVVPRVFAPLVHVPLVLLVGVDPDLGAVVRPHRPALELLEEVLRRRLGVLLSVRHLREHSMPMLRISLQERFSVQLLRESVDRGEPGVPLGLLVGIERLRKTKVDVGR